MAGNQVSWPIVIYGAPRSGTTFLQELINRHPEVYITRETRLFAWLHQSTHVLTQNDELVLSERLRFVEHLKRVCPPLIREFYRELDPTARYWGDKNPHYVHEDNAGTLETIVDLFPGSRFLHIIRDGRDVVSSLLRRRGVNREVWADFSGAHYTWKVHCDRGRSFGVGLPAGQYLEVRYEDLVRDGEAVARDIFDGLGIPMHADVLSFCKAQRRWRTPFSGPTRDLSRGAAASQWTATLSLLDQQRSLEELAEHLVRFGYETEESMDALWRDLRARIAEPQESAQNQERKAWLELERELEEQRALAQRLAEEVAQAQDAIHRLERDREERDLLREILAREMREREAIMTELQGEIDALRSGRIAPLQADPEVL